MTRVMIVDDHEDNLHYLQMLLTAAGYEVDSARQGVEALERARRARPDVVISDLLMPVMDGYTLLRHWKADTTLRAAPFIVYTGTYTNSDDEQLAVDLGADAFILKPAEPEALLARLREVESGPAIALPRPGEPFDPAVDQHLRQYSEVLIHKLESKSAQLEEINQALVRDIAARKLVEASLRESEQKFRLLTETIPQLVWIVRADGVNLFANQRWVDYTGLTGSETSDAGWQQVVHAEDRARAIAVFTEVSPRGGAVEARLRAVDGSYRWWLLRGRPVTDDSGAITRWIGTATDIDELEQAEARLRHTEEQLRQAQKMEAVGRLAGGVAHDFNNVLSVILCCADIVLHDMAPTDRCRPEVEEIRIASLRAATLTSQLLAFSRKQVLRPEVVAVGDVVAGMAPMLRRLLGADVELGFLSRPPWGKVVVDRGQLEQLLMNLVVNARDAMPRGGALVVEVANVELDDDYAAAHHGVVAGRYVMMVITDNGGGMDAATRALIFEPFFTTKALGKGTGLGLATVFGIVKQSGGHIWVYSEPGVGTTFKVYLPRTDLPSTTTTPGPRLPARGGTETVLLVEDDDQVRATTHAILSRGGYTVLGAASGGQALALCAGHAGPIHLLLTDVVLPRISGREIAERLAALRPGLRVLYVSGYTESSIVHQGVLDPGVAFLPKPITPDALLRKIRDVLDA